MATSTSQTILVTGGAGFIGTHLCAELVRRGNQVIVIDLKAPPRVVAGVEYIQGDVRNSALIEKHLDRVQTVYHLAATVSVPLCQNDPVESYSNNFTATLILLDAIRKKMTEQKRVIRFAFASTAALYGDAGNDGRALKEEDAADRFLSYYAAQKANSEQAIDLYRKTHGIPALAFRFFNVFGPGQDPSSPYSGVITVFARFAKEGKAMPLNGGGTQTRDFISVYDLVGALADSLKLSEDQWDASPINLGTGKVITVRELAETIKSVSGTASEITVAPPREGDVLHSKADITRARQVLHFNPSHSLRDGLRELI